MSFFGSLFTGLANSLFQQPVPNDSTAPPVQAPVQTPAAAPNPNLPAFLLTIRACEGTDGPNGYRMLFGGKLFDDFSQHPRISRQFTTTDGKAEWSSAAGAYQINWPSWCEHPGPDFSPASQDAWAVWAITEAGAMDDVVAGRLATALEKCSGRWASLPDARYPQPRKTLAFAQAAYLKAGGILG